MRTQRPVTGSWRWVVFSHRRDADAPLRAFVPSCLRASGPLHAFSVVELVVVIVIVTLILAVVIPGLSAMAVESRYAAATQTVRGAVTRAYIASQADRNMVAVRVVRDDWDVDPDGDASQPTGRQSLVTYAYRTSTDVPSGSNFKVQYDERFVRREGSKTVRLPTDVWAAPAEALSPNTTIRDRVLRGTVGEFRLDPTTGNFYTPDDFLIVFDPQTGLQGITRGTTPTTWPSYPLLATDFETDPNDPREAPNVQRYAFSGVVLYRREPFLALDGQTATPAERAEVLRRFGRSYFVHRTGGGLVMGFDNRNTQ